MAKYIVDGQKITNIANSIRNKKGVTTQFDIDEMPREIDSLSKGGAKIITNKKEGTQIPNTGYIEKIYFNINLSVEETEKILSQLTYSVIGGRWHFYSVIDTSEKITSGKKSISIDKFFENGIPVMYQIMERDSEIVIYNSSTGWNKEYSFIEINDNIFSVGNQNDLLKNIISETSFVSKEIELEGTYDGSSVEITELKANTINIETYIDNKQIPLEIKVPDNKVTVNSIAKGTAVPNSGYVEKVYLNTSLSVEEVVSIIENANLDLIMDFVYYLLINEDVSLGLGIMKDNNNLLISDTSGNKYFSSNINEAEGINFKGWNSDFNGVYNFNSTAVSSVTIDSTYPVGIQNNLLTNLISATPFERESVTLQGEYDGTPIEITENKVIDMKSYLDNKQLPLEVNVNIKGSGGVDIPKVSNITLNGSILSWDAPDFSELEQYKPIISYLVNTNGNELEISDTYCDITDYLVEGSNEVSIFVKAILEFKGNSFNQVVEYSAPIILDVIVTMNATLKYKMWGTSAVNINNKAYIFGGCQKTSEYYYIQCYEPLSDTITTMNTILPISLRETGVAAINNKAYIFGGWGGQTNQQTIYCYDPSSDTITTMSKRMGMGSTNPSVVAINGKAYIFGYSPSGSNDIQCYDPSTDTITRMSAKFPSTIRDMESVVIDGKAYIFGGNVSNAYVNTIYCYDPSSDTITTMNATLIKGIGYPSVVALNNKAYIFGGYDGSECINDIQCYDPSTDTITTLNITLTNKLRGTSAVVIDGKAYIFGGSTDNLFNSSNVSVNTIQKYE